MTDNTIYKNMFEPRRTYTEKKDIPTITKTGGYFKNNNNNQNKYKNNIKNRQTNNDSGDEISDSDEENNIIFDNVILWSDTKDIPDDADAYSKQLEQIKDIHHISRDILNECFKVVSNYIIRNKRILVGGMAIDNALRAKGSYLYDTLKIDYDFISTEFHKDAYNIGKELAQKFSGISIIGARHVSTMRVRYDFIPVADITYVPKNIYDDIPFIEYMGMRNIHPHFQMIDQHQSITHSLENPPQETIITSRYEKDVKRYILLSQFYPISISEKLTVPIAHYKIPYEYIYDNCLGGYISAVYWMKKIGVSTNASLSFSKDNLLVSIPEDGKIAIITDDFVSLLQKINSKNVKYYNSFLDKQPRHIEVESDNIIYQIYDNKGGKILAEELVKLHILGISGTMAWLLLQGIFYKNEWCLYLYKHLQVAFINDGHTKYLPSFKFYGKYNWSDSYLLQLERQLNKLGYKKIDNSAVPRNFHPKQGDTIPDDAYDFDPAKSTFYQQDGLECERFEEIQLPE